MKPFKPMKTSKPRSGVAQTPLTQIEREALTLLYDSGVSAEEVMTIAAERVEIHLNEPDEPIWQVKQQMIAALHAR